MCKAICNICNLARLAFSNMCFVYVHGPNYTFLTQVGYSMPALCSAHVMVVLNKQYDHSQYSCVSTAKIILVKGPEWPGTIGTNMI